MDWNAAIEHHREALKRVVAALIAMAALPHGAGAHKTLPRYRHRAVLRLLRPAESAARRLVIALARGLVVALPPVRRAGSGRRPASIVVRRGAGTGIVLPFGVSLDKPSVTPAPVRAPALPLFDPLRNPFRRRHPVAIDVPRISLPGVTLPFPVRRPPRRDDPLDATRLLRRLDALASALDDLPAQARRFARWQSSRDAAVAQSRNREAAAAQNGARRNAGRARRIWPLRGGHPYGARRPGSRRRAHEVDDILAAAHGLAFWALERSDTS